jgi:hypothetical protein
VEEEEVNSDISKRLKAQEVLWWNPEWVKVFGAPKPWEEVYKHWEKKEEYTHLFTEDGVCDHPELDDQIKRFRDKHRP